MIETNTLYSFSIYNINYTCSTIPPKDRFVAYLNRLSVQEAIRAPIKTYEMCNRSVILDLSMEDVSPPAYSVMPAILEQGIPINIYSTDYDFLLNHIGTELSIQNITW